MRNQDRIIRSAGVALATLFIVTGGVFAGRAIVEAPGATPGTDDSPEYETAEQSAAPTLDVNDLLSPLPTLQPDFVDDDFLASPSPDATAEPTESPDATAGATESPDATAGSTETPDASFDDHGGNSGPGSPNSGSDDDDDDSSNSGSGSMNSGPGSSNSGSGSDDSGSGPDDDHDDNSGSGSDD